MVVYRLGMENSCRHNTGTMLAGESAILTKFKQAYDFEEGRESDAMAYIIAQLDLNCNVTLLISGIKHGRLVGPSQKIK